MTALRVRLLLGMMLAGAAIVLGPVLAAAPANTDTGSANADATTTYGELFHWVDAMAVKYQMGTVYVGQQYLQSNYYGKTTGSTVMFNTSYVQNPAKLTADWASDAAINYHPGHPGAPCSAEQLVAVHESAHVLDNVTGRTAQRELADAIANGLTGELTGYSFNADGSVNLGEALADAMVAVECDTPTPAEQALYTILTT